MKRETRVPSPPRPLDGVVIADFSRVLAGPYCTMLLGDMGATVIKLESPEGDETRQWMPPRRGEESAYFMSINRNKRSVVVDLTTHEGRERAWSIIERSDVLIENLLPGKMAAFGLGFDDVLARRPGIVYASISGFGENGGAALPGYDVLVQAASGFMSLTGSPDGEGYRAGFAIFDVLTGLHVAVAVLAALRESERTGVGQRVATDLLSVALSSMVNQTGSAAIAGVIPWRMGNTHPSIAPYEPFPTLDGTLVLAVGNDRQFVRLCHALGLSEAAKDPRFASARARVDNRAALHATLVGALAMRSAAEWADRLQPHRIPCATMGSVADGLALADRLGLDPVATAGDVPTIRNPIRFGSTPVAYQLAPPVLGADDAWLDAWLAP